MYKVGDFHYIREERDAIFEAAGRDSQGLDGRYVIDFTASWETTEIYSNPLKESCSHEYPRELIGTIEYSRSGYTTFEVKENPPGSDFAKRSVPIWVDTGTDCHTVYAVSKSKTKEMLKELAILELRAFGYVKNGFAPAKPPQTWNPTLRWTPEKEERSRRRKT